MLRHCLTVGRRAPVRIAGVAPAAPAARGVVRATSTAAAASPAAAPTTAAAAGAAPARASGGSIRRKLLALALGAAIGLPAAKLYLAIRPLLGDSAPEKDPSRVSGLINSGRGEATRVRRAPASAGLAPGSSAAAAGGAKSVEEAVELLSWRLWLVSEASDRLIRDVYTAVRVLTLYTDAMRAGREDWKPVHQAAADALLRLVQVNKGVYVKLAQQVGQMQYLIPEEFVKTLGVMTHAAPEDTWEQVQAVWADEHGGRGFEADFEYVDPRPIASASLAQVHVGRLRSTGQRVAIKVQHEGLRETSQADIQTVAALVHIVKALFPRFNYEWLAQEIQENLPKELDFLHEAANAERTRANFASRGRRDIVVPTVDYSLSTHRCMVMSFEEGCYVNNVAAIKAQGLEPKAVASLVSEAFAEQVYLDGFLHCDPHAANMLVRPARGAAAGTRWWWPFGRASGERKPELVLLDHGLYRELSTDVRYNYAKMWLSLTRADEAGIKKYAARLNAGDMYRLFASMLTTRAWDKIMEAGDDPNALHVRGTAAEKAQTMGYAREYRDEIQDILRKLPRELLLVLKTNDCLRAVDMALGAPVNNMVVVARYCARALAEKRARSRPGFFTSSRNLWDWAELELRLRAFSWYVAFAGKRAAKQASKAQAKAGGAAAPASSSSSHGGANSAGAGPAGTLA